MRELDEILIDYDPKYDSIEKASRQIKKLMLDTLKECLGEEEKLEYEIGKFGTVKKRDVPAYTTEMVARNQLRQSALSKLEGILNERD